MIADISATIFGKIPLGAVKTSEGWFPVYRQKGGGHNPNSYVMFVRKVLWDLDIRTDKPRAVKLASRWSNRNWTRTWR